MSVEKRGKKYLARWRDPDGEQQSLSFDRKRDAEDFDKETRRDIRAGDYIDPQAGRITVAEFAPTWLATLSHLKKSTRQTYQQQLSKHILPRWGTTPLNQVRYEDIAVWVGQMQDDGLGGASVRYVYRVLSLLLTLAVRARRIRRNPAEGVKLPPAKKALKRYLTHEQVEALVGAADAYGEDYGVLVELLAYSGLRWGEAVAIRVGRVDLNRRRVRVAEAVSEVKGKLEWGTPKDHQLRSVPIGRELARRMTDLVAGKRPGDLLFTTRRGAVLRNLNARRDWFDAAAEAAGLAGLTPHELRHTAASLAVASGATVKAVQKMLGHESARMTLDVYADLFDDELDDVADRMEAAREEARQAAVRVTEKVAAKVAVKVVEEVADVVPIQGAVEGPLRAAKRASRSA